MHKVLLIEDNDEMRDNTAELLELSSYNVLTAPNGKKGVELAKQNSADLDVILCDIMMPELDGYGVLHILSKLPETENIPFIFLSAKSEKEDFRSGMNLGADDYITKPYTEIELLNAIERRINKQHTKSTVSISGNIQSFLLDGSRRLTEVFKDQRKSTFRKKETIFHEGDRMNYVHYISQGTVKIFSINSDGKEMIMKILKPGDFFDFTSALKGEEYLISAQALEDLFVKTINKDELLQLIMTDPRIGFYVSHSVATDNQNYRGKLASIAYNSVRKRVAEGLIYCFEKCGDNDGEINMSREDLANIVGTSTESVIRTLHDFKEEKLIDVSGRKISLLNKSGLIHIRS